MFLVEGDAPCGSNHDEEGGGASWIMWIIHLLYSMRNPRSDSCNRRHENISCMCSERRWRRKAEIEKGKELTIGKYLAQPRLYRSGSELKDMIWSCNRFESISLPKTDTLISAWPSFKIQ